MINNKIRVFDILISTLSLLILFPLLVLISFLIIISYGPPIIYKQQRVGYKGKKFIIFKFRTMINNISSDDNLRLTYFGKFLRKTSLDELPQFFNVLIKDMSIVGPRPLPENIENKIDILLRKKRRQILPGITGMSQINYSGKKRKLSNKIFLDIQFINNYNLFNYFKILSKTPYVLLVRLFKNKSSIIK
tara:strand:+ start:2473 stop:3042 length:570 start_codon:yes stop_codon:yes gene_type:complete